MIFNSLAFIVFFAFVLALYYRLGHRSQNRFLLLASYFFYGWWDWRFVGLLLFTSAVDFYVSKRLRAADGEGIRRRWVAFSVVTNLGVLGFFKYFNFFTDSMVALLNTVGFGADPVILRILLPVGISFYTFQSMGYVIDVYRRRLEPVKSLPDYLLYVSFFPQLVAGPIERAEHLLPQIQRRRTITAAQVSSGIWLILLGFVKKTVIADHMAAIVNQGFAGGDFAPHGINSLMFVYAFAFQIYGDFSGYSDIARGICKIMGFDILVNFRAPYLTSNPSDFWRHWHISLSTWIRDYLYIPLGGNRGGPTRTVKNLLLTMALAGLWHGAGFAYLLWGVYHGVLLVLHRFTGSARVFVGWGHWIRVIGFFHLTCFGWLIFRCGSLSTDQAAALGSFIANVADVRSLSPLWWPVLLLGVACLGLQWKSDEMDRFHEWSTVKQTAAVTSALVAITTLGVFEGSQFIYFQF